MVCFNLILKLSAGIHETSFDQLKCLISVEHSYDSLNWNKALWLIIVMWLGAANHSSALFQHCVATLLYLQFTYDIDCLPLLHYITLFNAKHFVQRSTICWCHRLLGRLPYLKIFLLNFGTKPLKMGQPRPLFRLFSSFQTIITILTTNKCENFHPVSGAGIRGHNLLITSLLA